MTTPSTITFSPPLPCSVLGESGETQCGKPATAATLYPMSGGQYILQPICKDCVAAMQRNYFPEQKARDEP